MEYYLEKFKALSDNKRIEILRYLKNKNELCVCDMCCCFNLSQSKLSYHLKILLKANLISKRTEGTWNYYTVNDEEIHKLLSEEVIAKIFH